MKTSHLLIGAGVIAAGVVGYVVYSNRQKAAATAAVQQKPTILGAIGGFLSQLGAATSSTTTSSTSKTSTAAATVGPDLWGDGTFA